MPKEETNSKRDVVVAINNAVAAAIRPARIGPISESRMKKLREVAQAAIAPFAELTVTDEPGVPPLLEPEELVAILVMSALYIQLKDVVKTTKVPFGGMAQEIFE